MGESAAPTSADGDAPACAKIAGPDIIQVAEKGDIVLDVTFETSNETLKKSRKAAAAALATTRKAPGGSNATPPTNLQPKFKVAYRVSLAALRKHSQYFENLLSNDQFREARLIAETHRKLEERNVKPTEADSADLPWISITDDDEATKATGREHAFEDILRIIHQKPPKATRADMSVVTTMAIIADRLDCVHAVYGSININLKFGWPATSERALVDESGRPTDVERNLRKKILVSWLLGQPMRLHNASRELIVRGSRLWSAYNEDDGGLTAAWWNLPEGIEAELQYRRECILNTIASVQRHFLNLYSSKERQCMLGYDSSAVCDSFQLGQMLKFLLSKELLFLVDFSTASLESVPDTAMKNIEELLSTLKGCPAYQIDKNHTNCGLKIRIDPILDYIQSMLGAAVVSINHADWKKRRFDVTWITPENEKEEGNEKKFVFTRALANDQRLRYEGAIYTDRMAKNLFTANSWDWTPEG
ncbi:hypothetical protein PT974_02498 [Cladobotryum mycophilum]|uniref:Hydroxyproline-rich glyco protein n=1 Tax=Cladobotryum mycophilum TaxID=491253 RepID=A0ABR0SZH0_9HYPO